MKGRECKKEMKQTSHSKFMETLKRAVDGGIYMKEIPIGLAVL